MTAQSFTPGPWVTADGYGPVEGGVAVQSIHDSWLICETTGYYGLDGRKANARLIAAAPDLYAVAEYMEDLLLRYEINHVSGEAISDAALEIVRAAIAKARGDA